MEWMNRANRPNQGPGQTVNPGANATHALTGVGRNREAEKKHHKPFTFANVTMGIMLLSLTLVAVGVIGFLMTTRQNDESRFVAEDKLQAVFLNGGQVYFGKIRELNGKYIGINDIYYLQVNQQVQPKQGQTNQQQDISLVKLGCELHGPQDQMLINRDQIVFWENLKSDGQVAKAVDEYKKANPNGQKCETGNAQQENENEAAPTSPANNQTDTTPNADN